MTTEEYNAKLKRIDELFEVLTRLPELGELLRLVDEVEAYEKHYSMGDKK